MVKLNEEEKKQKANEERLQEEKKVAAKEAKKTSTKKVVSDISVHATLDNLDIILYPLISEKAVNMIDAENKLTFVVSDTSDKQLVKKIFEEMYPVKVEYVNIIRDRKGRKKAIIKLKKEYKAQEIAAKLGVL
ncbi:MAG: 50S ribosomal protein L23 [Candidatus ainarchaeum sp.]|nr:50S ribosomal protein L23 [Candidatus ainarchaeum sp.]